MTESNYEYSSDDETISKDHKKLLQAVGSLNKVQHIRKVARKEASLSQNEFDLIKPRVELPRQVQPTKTSVSVVDLVKSLKGTSKHLTVGKELKNVQKSGKILPKPLEKPEAERLARTITYDKTKQELQRWDAVVAKLQSAETQTFPLDCETVYINTAKLKKPLPLSMKSELQIAIEEAEAKLRKLKGEKDNLMTDDDRVKEEMMLTKEEIKNRRRELLRLKMRESQKSAKLRLQNKIKSKKYHRIQKQHKLKEQLKEFELLQKQNPEEALEKLKSLERNRILERANLRHKNTGTWAKNNLVKAKYNRDIQKDLSEQLALSRQLTEKKDESEDEDDDKSDNDISNEVKDPFNPWMIAGSKKRDIKATNEVEVGYRKYWTERIENEKKLRDYQNLAVENPTTEPKNEEEKDESASPKDQVKKKKKNTKTKLLSNDSGIDVEVEDIPTSCKRIKKSKTKSKNKTSAPVIENGWIVEDVSEENTEANIHCIDKLFDKAEDAVLKKLTKKQLYAKKLLEKQSKKRTNKKRPIEEKDELKNLESLKFKNPLKRPDIDEELLETARGVEPELSTKIVPTAILSSDNSTKERDNIKHDNYADVKPKVLKTGFSEITNCNEDVDFEEDEDTIDIERQATINDAFEDDDIVADFNKEKNEKEKKLSDQINLSMPGWGSWAGTGIVQRAPQKEIVLQFDKNNDKKDDGKKERTRINEVVNKKLREHLVTDIPFPFTSVKDYEASIRTPIGRNYVPETAFRMLTKPAVITRKGHIIRPMDESQLVAPPKRPRNVVEKRIEYDAYIATQ